MGREYFSNVRYKGEASIYLGYASSFDSKEIYCEKIDVGLLKSEIINFIRLEDPRVFLCNGEIYALCACILINHFHGSNSNVVVQQIVIKIENNKVVAYKTFETHSKIEKNWVIFNLSDDDILLCYSLVPFKKIYTHLDLKNQNEIISIDIKMDFDLRNSTNFIENSGYKYTLAHKTIDLGYKYAYLHFFVRVDRNEHIERSKLFVFNNFGNEFAMSMLAIDDREWGILFSDHDHGNFMAKFTINDLKKITWQ